MARIPFRYGFDRQIAKRLLEFGLPLAAALGIESILLYSDSLVVGHLLGTTILGFYLLAFNISSWVPGIVGMAVRYVSIPSFSRLSEQEPEVLNAGVRRAIPLLVAFVVPIAAVMLVLGPAMIEFLYGSSWVPAAVALQFLAIVMIARMLTALSFDILTGMGRTVAPVWLNAGWAMALIPSLIIGAHVGGMRGVAIAHAIVAMIVAIPLAVLALGRAGIDLRSTTPRILRAVLAGIIAGFVMFAVSEPLLVSPVIELLIAGSAGLIAYCAAVVPVARWVVVRDRVRKSVARRRTRA